MKKNLGVIKIQFFLLIHRAGQILSKGQSYKSKEWMLRLNKFTSSSSGINFMQVDCLAIRRDSVIMTV